MKSSNSSFTAFHSQPKDDRYCMQLREYGALALCVVARRRLQPLLLQSVIAALRSSYEAHHARTQLELSAARV